jgi:PAS domain S-box-containing protein
MAFASFSGGGLMVRQLARNRQQALAHAAQLQEQVEGRREAEEELRVLVESSPAAILTAGADGRVVQANGAARRLLGAGGEALEGERLAAFLPALASALDRPGPQFRTNLECMGRRRDGGVFLAHVWFSSYTTRTGPRLAAIVLDASEQFRDREASGLDAAAATSRILFGAVSHEVRNLSAAASVAHANLGRTAGLAANEDYLALGALVDGLQRIASSELRLGSDRSSGSVDLETVLNELRIVVEPSLRESGVSFEIDIAPGLPHVVGEPHSLLQILLNLAQNSQRALASAERKRLLVRAEANGEAVTVRFSDTGPGVRHPERLFRPFQPGGEASGLGLFVSRTIARSFAGDLRYEPVPDGSCFALRLLSRTEG